MVTWPDRIAEETIEKERALSRALRAEQKIENLRNALLAILQDEEKEGE